MTTSTPSPEDTGHAAAARIDRRIAELGGWRGETLARMRALIHAAVPDVVEEWKWMGTPVWSHGGILCTGESYRDKIKLTFMKGASLDDPRGLFNAGLDGNARRAIDLHEGDTVDADAFKALVRAAAALNAGGGKAKKAGATPAAGNAKAATATSSKASAAKAAPSKAVRSSSASSKSAPSKSAPANAARSTSKGTR